MADAISFTVVVVFWEWCVLQRVFMNNQVCVQCTQQTNNEWWMTFFPLFLYWVVVVTNLLNGKGKSNSLGQISWGNLQSRRFRCYCCGRILVDISHGVMDDFWEHFGRMTCWPHLAPQKCCEHSNIGKWPNQPSTWYKTKQKKNLTIDRKRNNSHQIDSLV